MARRAHSAEKRTRVVSKSGGCAICGSFFAKPLALGFRGPLARSAAKGRPMTRPVKGPPVAFLIPARGHREKRQEHAPPFLDASARVYARRRIVMTK